ncbi:MAG: class I SAM-dependent methyltransferase, partial [Patescibacteria group bacterium]
DVGCSYPWFLSYVQKNGAKEVAGIEPDIVKVKAARKQVPKAKILQGHAGDLKFTNKSFDLVTLFDVIEHIPSNTEPDTLKEINRVLKPGGHLIISTPLAHWFSMITDPAWYFGHRHYSENQLSEMLEKTGFKIKSVVTHGGIWEIIGMWVLYISKWIFKIKMPFEDWFDSKRRKEFKERGFTHIMLIAQKTT